ncbi:general negative regulator of transcription subunit 4 [Phtheirospermum japonicum]|uniref:General negative regulator of transcription subunit 4 n=1 Tax=Phtheirospermum japonicum TaxID=374723 RepID=A0A830CRP1_9LAMI|nr:general negative regulator of transcription subunit 4 [Phtheirospermum japonicum]
MISDSIPNASIALALSNPKDFAKKKRANRSAKLKQCKLDARREQWLSQVKNKGGCKEEVVSGNPTRSVNGRTMPTEKLEIKPRVVDEIYGNGPHFRDSDSSSSKSPTSRISSLLGRNDSGVTFTASSRSSSSNSCFSGSMSDEEDVGDHDDDDCLDDWEAMADALAADELKNSSSSEHGSQSGVETERFFGNDTSNGNQESRGAAIGPRAWRPNDEFRPQSLPNLKLISDARDLSCPICFEDLDGTDSSFLPCLCGFRLCLFCHKRIIEDDGRCPGCRKKYDCESTLDGCGLAYRFARSCSMVTRS